MRSFLVSSITTISVLIKLCVTILRAIHGKAMPYKVVATILNVGAARDSINKNPMFSYDIERNSKGILSKDRENVCLCLYLDNIFQII
jgi:hypothetical protein